MSAETQLQGTQHEISEDARKALARARKILDMASRPPDAADTPAQAAAKEAERAVAAEKYQAVLLEYNLTQAQVEQTGSEAEGRREEAKLKAGMYTWQRELWEAVAELNFCLYYCADDWVKQNTHTKGWDGQVRKSWRWRRAKQHRIVGRVVNTQATINLCLYLESAIERAVRERLHEAGYTTPKALNNMLFSRFAVSFREGAADDVMRRVNDQRRDQLKKESELARAAEERAAEAAASGVSNSTAITIATYARSEMDLNTDVSLGREPGTTTRMRAEKAAKKAAEEARYTAWAAAHPEEAAAAEAERREESRRYWARANANYRGGPAPKERDQTAYRQGARAGEKIGLDIQAGGSGKKGALS